MQVLTKDHTLVMNTRYAGIVRLGVGFDEDGQPYLFPLASVIDNYGGTAAESAARRKAGLELDARDGDEFMTEPDGAVYMLSDEDPFAYPVFDWAGTNVVRLLTTEQWVGSDEDVKTAIELLAAVLVNRAKAASR